MKMLKLIYIVLFLAIGIPLKAQNDVLQKELSIDLKNSNTIELLNYISDKYKIFFSYEPKIFDNKEKRDFKFENTTLQEILKTVLGEEIEIKTINNQVIFYKKENTGIMKQTLRGRVIDKDTKTPLFGATIVLEGTNPVRGTVTDTDGYYSISNVPVGRQTVTASYVGYKPVTFDNIMLLSAKEKLLNIEMEESMNDIAEVQVFAYARKEDALNEMATVGARSFSIEETEKYAGSWGDPSRMAINFAGVVMAGDERNDIVIRGNSPTALIWQLEGLPIPSPNHFDNLGATGGPVSILNNNTLSRSDFFTGAFPAEYGNGYSGVFDLHMRNGNNEKYEFLAQLGFGGFELGAEGPISRKNKSSFIINYRYSMLGLVDEMLWIDELPHYQDMTYKINMPYENGNVSVFGFAGMSDISFYFVEPIEDETVKWEDEELDGSRTFFSGIKNTHFINNKTRLINSFAYSFRNPFSDNTYKRNDKIMGDLLESEDKEIKYLFSSKIISKINRANVLKAGVRLEREDIYSIYYSNYIENDSLIHEKITDTNKEGVYTLNSFIDFQHKFNDNLTVNTGLHFQYFMFNNTQSIEPRLGIKYKYSEKGKIGLAYGNHCQVQSLFNYLIPDSMGNQNNKNLDFIRSHQFVLGHDYSFTSNLRLKVEGYYQHIYSVPVHKNDGTFSLINYGISEDIIWRDGLVNKGTGENYGIDVTFEKFLSDGYYYLFTTSLFNSTYKGIDGVKRNTRYNGNFVINALGGYEIKVGKNNLLDFNIRCVYAGGMRYTAINVTQFGEEGFTKINYENAFDGQLNNYFRLDFRIGFVLQRKKVSHEIGFEITNLTNHQNEYARYYNSYTKSTISEYQQGFFPMGLYRLSF